MKNLGKESRKGLTNGLREFIKVDNERVLEVGSLSRGTGTFQVRKPNVPGGCPEVIVRKNSDEVTLRAEEVGTSKGLVNVNHIEPERWSPLLVDADWYAFCQALYKGIEGEDWEDMYFPFKEMRRTGSEEATGGPKSKSPLENEGSQGCRRRILRPHA